MGAAPNLDLTLRGVLALAFPVMASGVLQSVFRPIDQYFVQDLGVAAQGALGATTMVTILTYAALQVVSVGVAAFVGRATGAGDPVARREVVEQGLGACAVLAIGLAILGTLAVGPLVGLLGLEGEGAGHAVAYLRVLFLLGGALAFAPTVDAVFHAMGDTRMPLVLQLAAVALNVVLTPWFVPRIGVAGAALGTVIAQTLATGLGLWVLAQRLGLGWASVRIGDRTRRIVEVGLPVGLASAMFGGVYWLMMGTTIHALGQDVYAGLGLGFGVLESLAWPTYMGLSVAASSLVSRLLGAGRPDLAVRAVKLCMAPALCAGFFMSGVYAIGGETIMRAFAKDPASFREGLRYATLLAIAQPFVAIEAVSEGVLAGSGDTRKLFWTNVPLNLVRVPLSWWFAITLGFGANGLWWAINASTFVKASAKLGLVLHGGWRHKELS